MKLFKWMESPIIVKGNSVNLTLPVEDDIEYLIKWINDPEINKYLRFPNRIFFRKDEEEWLESIRKNQEGLKIFIIRDVEQSRPMGTIGLHNIDKYNGHAELGYLLAKERWGKGHMTEAVSLMVNYGFQVLNLRKIYAFVKEGNIASIKVLKKNDFNEVGRFREHDYVPYEGFRDLLIFEKFRQHEKIRNSTG
jgi:ribosomal-protein-alanine N-acetyltransferase